MRTVFNGLFCGLPYPDSWIFMHINLVINRAWGGIRDLVALSNLQLPLFNYKCKFPGITGSLLTHEVSTTDICPRGDICADRA